MIFASRFFRRLARRPIHLPAAAVLAAGVAAPAEAQDRAIASAAHMPGFDERQEARHGS